MRRRPPSWRSSKQLAGQRSGRFAVFKGHGAALNGEAVAGRRLQETTSARGQVGLDARRVAVQRGVVDDVEVGEVSGRDESAVRPTEVQRGSSRQLVHDRLEWDSSR